MLFLGWKIDQEEREALLARFPPRYANPDADHITFAAAENAPPIPEADQALIVGRADDGVGVEAMVVEVAGTTHRPAGGTYHITWSLAEGRRPVESNAVIAEHGWERLEDAVPVSIQSATWP